MGEAVGAVLKQAVERIARVREAATRCVRVMLADDRLRLVIPEAEALEACTIQVNQEEAQKQACNLGTYHRGFQQRHLEAVN